MSISTSDSIDTSDYLLFTFHNEWKKINSINLDIENKNNFVWGNKFLANNQNKQWNVYV